MLPKTGKRQLLPTFVKEESPMLETDELLTPEDVAKRLRLARGTVYNMISSGRLPAFRINRRCVRIPRRALLAWLEEFRQRPFDPAATDVA